MAPPPEHVGGRSPTAGLLLAALALPLALLGAPAEADLLLTSMRASHDSDLEVGPSSTPGARYTQAIRFQTGDNEGGYTLTNIRTFVSGDSPDSDVRARIFSASGGSPGSSLYTLASPVYSTGAKRFDATGASLDKSTQYFVVFDSLSEDTGYSIRATNADSFPALNAGWTLNTERHSRTSDNGSWSTSTEVPRLEISGIVVTSTDSTLSGLALETRDGTAVPFSPAFATGTMSYTADVDAAVNRLSIKPVTSGDGATIEYLDDSGTTLEDRSRSREGHQVRLAPGENAITLKVTAQDGIATSTYTLTVNRAVPFHGAFEDVPAYHDGSTAFDVRLRFEEDVASPVANVRAAVAVTNGTMSGLAAVEGSARLYGMTITPTSAAPVHMEVSRSAGCDAGDDICTSDGKQFWGAAYWVSTADDARLRALWVVVTKSGEWIGLHPVDETWTGFQGAVAGDAAWSGFDPEETRYAAYKLTDERDRVTLNLRPFTDGASMRVTGPADSLGAAADYPNGGRALEIDVPKGNNTWSVWVTSADGDVLKGYHLTIGRTTVPVPPDLVDCIDETFASVTVTPVGGGAVSIAPQTCREYVMTVSSNTHRIRVSPEVFDPGWAVTMRRGWGSRIQFDESDALQLRQGSGYTAVEIRVQRGGGGEDSYTLRLKRTSELGPEAPDAPSAPTLTSGTTWVEASWTAPADNGSAITDYDVHYRVTGGGWRNADHAGTGTAKRIEGLDADTAYEVRVRASNAGGAGDWSAAASGRTEAAVPNAPSAPLAATLTAGTTWVEASWTAPADNGSAITDYDVEYRETGGNWQDADHAGTDTTKRIEGLAPNTAYEVRVRASNAGGAGDWSAAASGRTEAAAPDAPSAPTLTSGTTWVEALWTAPSDNGAAITDYDVEYRETGGDWQGGDHTGTGTTKRIEGLSSDTAYEVRVRASNAGGAGAWSATATGRTAPEATLTASFEDVPSAHDGSTEFTLTLKFSARVSTLVRVLRNDRLSIANGTATGMRRVNRTSEGAAEFTLRVTPAGSADVTVSLPADGTACAAGGVCTADGVQLTQGASATVPGPAADVPDAPSAPTLTAGSTWLEASWTAPSDNGAAITDYGVEYRETGESWTDAAHAGTATTKRIEGLTAATSYEVRVRATNTQGTSAWSPAASGSTTAADGAAEGDVRLVNGGNAQEGRVEIYHDGEWGTVCDDRWTGDDAEVVCRQLGHIGGTAHVRAAFGAGSGTIWMDDVQCAGSESHLADCPFAGWGVNNCRHREDAGVSCGSTSGLPLSSATVLGAQVTLRYERDLDGGSVPSPGDFVVAGGPAGAVALPVESVAVIDGTAVLTLSRAVEKSEHVTVSYLPAPMHPLQDGSYNPAPMLTGEPVEHAPRAQGPSNAMGLEILTTGARVAAPGPDAWHPTAKVEVLDLSQRGLDDLSTLSGLGDVEVLDLGGNRIADLSPLAGMAGLERLDLRDNGVADLSALGGLSGLRVLDLSENAVADISPLAALTGLRRLDLSGNRVADLRPLSELRGLEVLLLDGNLVSDLVPLWGLVELAHLGLGGNRVADVALLRDARSLRRLDLSGNRVRDVSVLGGLPNLVSLRLSGNPLADLAPLGRLTNVRWLWVDARTSPVRTPSWPNADRARLTAPD